MSIGDALRRTGRCNAIDRGHRLRCAFVIGIDGRNRFVCSDVVNRFVLQLRGGCIGRLQSRRVRQRHGDRVPGRSIERGNRPAGEVFPRSEVDRRVERRRGRDPGRRCGGRIVGVPDRVVGVMGKRGIVDAGIRQRVRCGVVERSGAPIGNRRVDTGFCRHECVQRDRRVVVVRGRGIGSGLNAGVMGRDAVRRGDEPVRHGSRHRRGNAAGCRGRVRGIGRLRTAERGPLCGAGLDRAQRVVNARRRRDRCGGFFRPCIKRRARRRLLRRAAARGVRRQT
ncbi:hypothetical protein OEJ37_31660, partial [Burkholderia sp. BKH01]|nr:hypothetical protein [Burkholderia sp. BKH01]